MLKLHNRQMEEFSKPNYESFELRVIEHLRKFLTQGLPDSSAETKSFIKRCREKAKLYGLSSEQSVVYFIHLVLLLGEEFETSKRYPFATAVLHARAGTPQERIKIAMLLAYQLKAKGIIP